MLGDFYTIDDSKITDLIKILNDYGKVIDFTGRKSNTPIEKNLDKTYFDKESYSNSTITYESAIKYIIKPSRFLWQAVEDKTNPVKLVLFGLRPCELRAFKVMDAVYLNKEPVDYDYRDLRDNSLIIASDCDTICKDCFLASFSEKPYPTYGFDINIAHTNSNLMLQAGSEKGLEIIETIEASKSQIDDLKNLEKKREKLEIVFSKSQYDISSIYTIDNIELIKSVLCQKSIGEGCVGCGACDYICPVNIKFSIKGKPDFKMAENISYFEDKIESTSVFRDRFLHKYVLFDKFYGIKNCVGCGRCTAACPGGINIKSIHRELSTFVERESDEAKAI